MGNPDKGDRRESGASWGYPPPTPPKHNRPLDQGQGLKHGSPDSIFLNNAKGSGLLSGTSAGYGESSAAGNDSSDGAGGSSAKRQRRDSSAGASSMFGLAEDIADNRPLAITCAPCRTRKIKCDSKKPVCENCSKNPKECYYPLKLKPGLRPGTGTDMVKRIEMLEDRVHVQEARLADHEARLTALTNQALNPFDQGNNQPFQSNQSNNQSTGLTPLLSLPSMPMSNPSIAQPLPDIGPSSTGSHGPGSGGPFDFTAHTVNSFGGPSASPSGLSTTSFHDPGVLPPPDIVYDLINLFWTHIHPWAPILAPIPIQTQPPWNIVVHAIVVVTLRYSFDPRLEGKHDMYKRAAKQHVLSHAIESTSISSVQALALLALDLIGSDQGPSSWGILALLTRSAVHLGLTTEDESLTNNAGLSNGGTSGLSNKAPTPSLSRTSIIPPAANWEEDECRRRLYWLIFSLDRYACAATGWDFALPDFDVNRRLPCADKLWAKQEWYITPTFKPIPHLLSPPNQANLSPLAFLVEALDLLGRAHTLQSRNIDPGDSRAVERRRDASVTLSSAARRWFGDLALREGRQNGMTLMIQAIHHATLLKINAYYAFPALSNGEPIEPYTFTCLSSARSLVALAAVAKNIGYTTSSSPLFIWSLWVAARVLFVHAFLSHQAQPDEDFDTIVGCLKEQAQFWSLANQYVKLLERAKRKWLQSTMDTNPNLPDAIHVLLDLRRTAYSAVAGNTEQTPFHSPGEMNLSHLPAWAVQPLLGDLHSWFDLPAGVFQNDM